MADVVPNSMALAFVTKMCKKCKSTSPSAIQMKNWQKKALKRNYMQQTDLKKVNKLLTYTMLDLLTVA
jgi:disulfide oxidoreductase YuzD